MEETKTRILDAAERLLSERGFSGTSLRGITALAGVNLGAVNYHFRSKKGLIHAVFTRRMQPISQERLAALDACEAEAGGKPVPLEQLLQAFFHPVLKLGREGETFIRLLGRMYTEPTLDLQRIFGSELEEVVQRFLGAFSRTLPDLDRADLFWRLFFIIGAMAQVLAAGSILRFLSGGICDPKDMNDVEERLVRFASAGLSAPPIKSVADQCGAAGPILEA